MAKARKKKIESRIRKPFPCPAPAPHEPNAPPCCGVLVPRSRAGKLIDLEHGDAEMWSCSIDGGPGCGFVVMDDEERDAERCPNDGAPLRFDPAIVGHTCGGLLLRGWNVCDHCSGVWLTRKATPDTGAAGADGRWRLASGGRSLDAGPYRLRVDHKAAGKRGEQDKEADDIVQLMARISRVPAFEAALEKIARGELDAQAMRDLAARALSIGDAESEITE